MILHAAALAVALHQPTKVPFRLMATTEMRSPVAPSGVLIRDRRKAYEFFGLLKEGAPKPLFLKRVNWARQSVLVLYPGLIQKDARATTQKLNKSGGALYTYVQIRRGITAETFYPALLLTIPRQSRGTEVHADIRTISVLARK